MDPLAKKIDKRNLFVTIGCAKYPYAKIKEMYGDKDALNLEQFMEMEIPPDERVNVIQELHLFPIGMQRLLAFHFAKETYKEALPDLTKEDVKLGEQALHLFRGILLGETDKLGYGPMRKSIIKHLTTNLRHLDYSKNKNRIGTFEILLTVFKDDPYQALRESTSIQRDLFGEQKAVQQMKDMLRFAQNYFLKPV
jgi:hypothetical protein